MNYLNVSEFVAEIEISGRFVTLYRYSKRKYYLCVEGEEPREFPNRKAVDAFISRME